MVSLFSRHTHSRALPIHYGSVSTSGAIKRSCEGNWEGHIRKAGFSPVGGRGGVVACERKKSGKSRPECEFFQFCFPSCLHSGKGREDESFPSSFYRSFTSFYFQSRFIWRLKRVFKEVNLWRKNDTMAVFIWFCYSRSGAVKLHSTHSKDFNFFAI